MGSGNTNFLSTVGVQSLGTSDIDKMVAAIDKQSSALDNLGKKATQVNEHPGFNAFAEKVRQGIENPLQAMGGAAESALQALGPVGVGVTATAGIFAAAGVAIVSAARSLGEYATTIENASIKTGLMNTQVESFVFAAKVHGQDIGAFEVGMRKLSQGIADNSEAGAKARDALEKLGVQYRTLTGETRSTSEIFYQIADGLNRLPTAFERNAAAVAIFGRSGIELIPTLLSLRQNVEWFDAHGLGSTGEDLKRWEDYRQKITEVEAVWERFKRSAKEKIVVFIQPVIAPSSEFHPEADRYQVSPAGGGMRWHGIPIGPQGGASGWESDVVGQALAQRLHADRLNTEAALNPLTASESASFSALFAPSTDQDRLSLAKTHLSELQGQFRTGVAPGMSFLGDNGDLTSNEQLRQKVVATKSEIASIEAHIKATEDAKKAAEDFAHMLETAADAARKAYDAYTGKLLTGGDTLFQQTHNVSDVEQLGTQTGGPFGTWTPSRFALQNLQLGLINPYNRNLQPANEDQQASDFGDYYANIITPRQKREGELRLRDAQNQSSRGLGLFSSQANLAGVDEAPQANQLYQLRMKYADSEYDALKRLAETRATEDEKQQAREDALDQLHQKRFDADMERQQSILQIALQQKGASEATASGLFDAIHSRTTNQYWRQFAVGQERQLFTNAASPLILGATRFLGSAIPGQTDAAGNPTDIGKLLHGTLLDNANADPARQTAANTANTVKALLDLPAKLASIFLGGPNGAAAAGVSVSSLAGLPNAFDAFNNPSLNPTLFGSGGLMGTGIGTSLYNLPSASSVFTNPLLNPGLPTSNGTSGFAQFLAGVGGGPSAAIASFLGTPRGTVGYGPDGTPHDQYGNPITSSTAAQVGQGVSIAAAAATGIMAAVKDFSHGGAGGALGGVSALAGLASLIPGAGVVAAPIAAVTSLLGSLLSTGPQQREKDIFNALSSNRYLAPTALNVTQGPGGNYEDFDARGNLRTSNFSAVPTVAEPYITSRVVNGQRTYYDVPGGQLAPYSNGPTGAGQTAGSSVPQIGVLNLNAIDTQSGVDFLNKNRSAIGRNVTEHLQTNNGGPLAAEIRFHANS